MVVEIRPFKVGLSNSLCLTFFFDLPTDLQNERRRNHQLRLHKHEAMGIIYRFCKSGPLSASLISRYCPERVVDQTWKNQFLSLLQPYSPQNKILPTYGPQFWIPYNISRISSHTMCPWIEFLHNEMVIQSFHFLSPKYLVSKIQN